MKNFNEWVSSIAEAGRELIPGIGRQGKKRTLPNLCHELCTSKGEAMGTALADEVVKAYKALNADGRIAFYDMLYREFSADPDEILECAEAFKEKQDRATYTALSKAIESPRLTLFRSINMAPQGTATLIQMREHLLRQLKLHPEFSGIDEDLKHLLASWFNRGFLSLERISWQTPAHVLEKLIAYEAVHEMTGWDDLRRRLAEDRRCFAFFHPALEDEPLIFVQVALVKGMAGNIQELLARPVIESDDPKPKAKSNGSQGEHPQPDFDTAIFYSISNCQAGLKGISFGNFLIKQVVLELRNEFPQLKQFATLSPIPGFRRWLDAEIENPESTIITDENRKHLKLLDSPTWTDDPACCEILQPLLTRLCAHYLYHAKKQNGPLDPVARFHLGNGAEIARLNWLGDRSANGLNQSAGMLVNYAYVLKNVEKNHEAFVNEGRIAVSSEFQKLLK